MSLPYDRPIFVTCKRDPRMHFEDKHGVPDPADLVGHVYEDCIDPVSADWLGMVQRIGHPILDRGLLPLLRQIWTEIKCEVGWKRCAPRCFRFRTLQGDIQFERDLRRSWR